MKKFTAFFCGYDSTSNPAIKHNATELELIKLIEHEGVYRFLCSMDKGFESMAAQTVLDLKRYYTHIKLIAVTSYPLYDGATRTRRFMTFF